MATYELSVNGRVHTLDVDPELPLLWALRDHLALTGTKYSCGQGLCGSCTVHVNGEATRSCVTTVAQVQGARVTTIEGLAAAGSAHPVQAAWIAEQVPQCGYCQPGQIMAAAALLAATPHPTDAEIDRALSGNLCRCGAYPAIRRAVHRAAGEGAGR
jgi:aerobic-type carbon monoxide dehydrogenase small subunit (CoxS/CutS family)